MSVTLYYHPLSSYCQKVLVALYESGLPFEKKLINLGDASDRAELEKVWPLCKFPVIRDVSRNRELAEASIIIEYLDRYSPGPKLIPADWDAALEVRLWDRIFDNYVQGPLQAMVNDRLRKTQLDLSREHTTLATAYRMIDQHLQSRTWISQHGFGMADCAAAPALFYTYALQPFPNELKRLHAYFERLVERESVKRVLEEAKPFLQYFPFVAGMPARFLPAAG